MSSADAVLTLEELKKIPLNEKSSEGGYNRRTEAFFLANQIATQYAEKCRIFFLFKTLSFFVGEKTALSLYSKIIFQNAITPCLAITRLKYCSGTTSYPDIPVEEKLTLGFLNEDMRFEHLHFIPSNPIKIRQFIIAAIRTVLNFFAIVHILFLRRESLPRIGVEVSEGFNWETSRSEANWIQHDLNNGEYASFFVFGGNSKLINKKDFEMIRKTRIRPNQVYVDDWLLSVNFGLSFIFSPKAVNLAAPFHLKSINGYAASWIAVFIYWKILYKKLNIKAWLMTSEFPTDSLLQRSAIEKNHGFLVTRQRSELTSTLGHKHQPGHIGLFWNDFGEDHYNKLQNGIERGFVIGHTFIDRAQQKTYEIEGLKIRSSIAKNLIDPIVISIFDSNHTSEINGQCFDVTTEEVLNILKIMCAHLKRNANLCLIIKSKKHDTVLPFLPKEIRDFLTSSERVLLLGGNVLPAIICLASDLNIGLVSNSAAWEGNILHKRSIFYCKNVADDHIFLKTDPKKYLIENPEEFDRLIQNTTLSSLHDINNNLGLTDKTDFHLFDKFSDGRGPLKTAIILEACRFSSHHLPRSETYRMIDMKLALLEKAAS